VAVGIPTRPIKKDSKACNAGPDVGMCPHGRLSVTNRLPRCTNCTPTEASEVLRMGSRIVLVSIDAIVVLERDICVGGS